MTGHCANTVHYHFFQLSALAPTTFFILPTLDNHFLVGSPPLQQLRKHVIQEMLKLASAGLVTWYTITVLGMTGDISMKEQRMLN